MIKLKENCSIVLGIATTCFLIVYGMISLIEDIKVWFF